MPNWVFNRIYVKNNGPEFEEIKTFFEAAVAKNDSLFQSIDPMPAELDTSRKITEKASLHGTTIEGMVGCKKISDEQALLLEIAHAQSSWEEEQSGQGEKNLERFGAKDWHDWRLDHWGCKWEADSLEILNSNENEISIKFYTPWDWPYRIYQTLSSRYPNTSVLVYAWSIEGSFVKYAGYTPNSNWHIQRFDFMIPSSGQEISFTLDREISDLSAQFKYPPPTMFEMAEITGGDSSSFLLYGSDPSFELIPGNTSAKKNGGVRE